MHRLAAELVFDELAAREAEARGHQNRDEVRIPVRDKRFKLLGERMFAAEMATEPSLDEVRGFFDDHREQFRSHTVVTVREILVDSPADADSLHQLVEAGGALEELARQHTVRSDLRLTGGLWEDVRPKDPRSDRIYQAALRQGPGLHPPLKVPGGHSVFEVLEIRPGEMLTFEEAAGSARKSLASFRMEALIARLRQEYSEHISVDPGAHGRPALDTR